MSQFFLELQIFSDRFVKDELKLDSSISPWGAPEFEGGSPKGAVIHFTADEELLRVLRWFIKEGFKSRVSSHVVVADRKLGTHKDLAKDLPLIQKLPTTVIQCRKPDMTAWHATWTNSLCYGIENVCAGELRREPTGSFTSWQPRDRSSPEWTMPWSVPYKTPVQARGRWWSPYTQAQIETNITLLRELRALYPRLERDWILGHEQVQSVDTRTSSGLRLRTDKRDPGPHYPLPEVREAVFGVDPPDTYGWLKQWNINPSYHKAWADSLVINWIQYELADRMYVNPTPEIAWKRFTSAVQALAGEALDIDVFATAMTLLGYAGASRQSVEIFQRMMGIHVDGYAGPITCGALLERLADRGFISESDEVAST